MGETEPRTETEAAVSDILASYLRVLPHFEDVDEGLDAAFENLVSSMRDWIRSLLAAGRISFERLEELTDFPCLGCPARSYRDGPHKFGCSYKGAKAGQMVFHAKKKK